jgi:hypothetical protein
MDRLIHVIIGADSWFVLRIKHLTYYLLKTRHLDFARKSFNACWLRPFIHCHAGLGGFDARVVTAINPPNRVMEGFIGRPRRPDSLFGVPTANRVVRFNGDTRFLSFLVHRDFNTCAGAGRQPDVPPDPILLISCHGGIGTFFIALTLYALWCHTEALCSKEMAPVGFVFPLLAFVASQLRWLQLKSEDSRGYLRSASHRRAVPEPRLIAGAWLDHYV